MRQYRTNMVLMNTTVAAIFVSLVFSSNLAFAENCTKPVEMANHISGSEKLKPLTKTLEQMQPKTFYAVHGMKQSFLNWLEPIYKTSCGQAPTDWPFRQGKSYPGLWTAYNPDSNEIQFIDGNTDKITYGGGEVGIALRFDLDSTKPILYMADFDASDEVKQELRSIKIKNVGAPEQWNKWAHGRKVLIQLAAEAGYSALFLLNKYEPSRSELVILETSIIKSIAKFDSDSKTWIDLSK